MKYDILFTYKAENDLKSIYNYIANNLKSPLTAVNVLNKIENRILKLENLPHRYKFYENEPWKSKGLRDMPVDNFIVLYYVDDTGHTVSIIRVIYGGKDIDAELSE